MFGNGEEAERTVGLVPDSLRSTAFRAGRDVVLDVYGDLWPPIATTDSLESLRDSRVAAELMVVEYAGDE